MAMYRVTAIGGCANQKCGLKVNQKEWGVAVQQQSRVTYGENEMPTEFSIKILFIATCLVVPFLWGLAVEALFSRLVKRGRRNGKDRGQDKANQTP